MIVTRDNALENLYLFIFLLKPYWRTFSDNSGIEQKKGTTKIGAKFIPRYGNMYGNAYGKPW